MLGLRMVTAKKSTKRQAVRSSAPRQSWAGAGLRMPRAGLSERPGRAVGSCSALFFGGISGKLQKDYHNYVYERVLYIHHLPGQSCPEGQWGRDLLVAETRDLPGPDHHGLPASKEPQPFSRGDLARNSQSEHQLAASMEPRPFSRGDSRSTTPAATIRHCFNGAATIQSRRLGTFWACDPNPGLASMEPRPFSRGDDAGRHERNRGVIASMEPRPFSRGDSTLPVPLPASSPRFNGAATIQSRRRSWSSSCARYSMPLQWSRDHSVAETRSRWRHPRGVHGSFNGAATIQSRRLRSLASKTARSSSFNGAATIQSRRHDALQPWPWPRARASMEPRPFSRGDQFYLSSLLQLAEASMEPRPFSRGDYAYEGLPDAGQNASMEPRPFSRGDLDIHAGRRAHRYGFNGAATIQSRRLQVRPTVTAPRPCFNGAATIQSRRPVSVGSGPRPGKRLQWSRDHSVAETSSRHPFRPSGRCFNGAATIQSRRLPFRN